MLIKPTAFILSALLAGFMLPALAESCLQTDKQGREGDSRYYDYGRCKQGQNQGSNVLTIVGKQMQGIMAERAEREKAEDAAVTRSNNAFLAEQRQFWKDMRFGTSLELVNGQESVATYTYKNANISEAERKSIRADIATTLEAGKLLAVYGGANYVDSAVSGSPWQAPKPADRWKTCEVATLLARAYVFGDFIAPEQKDPAKGLAIARTGTDRYCGGAAYWLGRIYEGGDAVAPGVDEILDEYPRNRIRDAYEVAIVNGVTPAYERAAETNMHALPRYKDKSYGFISSTPYWPEPQKDEFGLATFQYRKCLELDASNLVCARGLRDIYSDNNRYASDKKSFAYYDAYVQKIEGLLAQAGVVPPSNSK